MAAYNTSSAYNLSAYETAGKKTAPQLNVVGKRLPKQTLAVAFSPKVMCAFAIVVTMLSLLVYNQVRLTETTAQINSLNKEIKVMQAENVRMASSLEATVSLRSVAEQARDQLGMERLDKYQTEYINLYQDDKIVLAREPQKENTFEKAGLVISSLIKSIQSYIGE